MHRKYTVIYLWQGERYRSETLPRAEALALLAEFRSDGWRAWLEASC